MTVQWREQLQDDEHAGCYSTQGDHEKVGVEILGNELRHGGWYRQKTQGCKLGVQDRVRDRMAWRIQSKKHIHEDAATPPNL